MTSHICTTQSLRAGMEHIPPMECNICGHKTMFVDWVGCLCDTCGADIEMTRAELVNVLRHKAGFKRRDIAALIGVKPKTVSVYEHDWPSKKYLDQLIQIIRDHYAEAQPA